MDPHISEDTCVVCWEKIWVSPSLNAHTNIQQVDMHSVSIREGLVGCLYISVHLFARSTYQGAIFPCTATFRPGNPRQNTSPHHHPQYVAPGSNARNHCCGSSLFMLLILWNLSEGF